MLACTAVIGSAAMAEAQVRTTFGVNGGIQTIGQTASQNFSVQKNLETAPIAAALSLGSATFIDFSAAVTHEPSRLGGSISVSSVRRQFGGDVSAQIPHPFFFNTPRPVSGSASGLHDTELVLHLDVTYRLRGSDRFDLVGFAGPSMFKVTRDFVTNVTVSETYPYDTATFESAQTSSTRADTLGFNVGADMTWKLSRRIGVGALIRYAHGSIVLTPSAGNSVSTKLGGLQLGGGLRLLY
ncbi:MAG: hypothetical protein WBD07_04975 [Vicinamibacterales bacterium]